MEILNKIAIATCMATPEIELVEIEGKKFPRAKGEQALLRIVGEARGVQRGKSTFGPWVKFLGYFEATNAKTGEIYRSSACLFPDSFSGMLAAAVNVEEMIDDGTADEAGNTTETGYGNVVRFAVDIGCKPAKTATGYTYTVKPLIETASNDPLAALRGMLADIPLVGYKGPVIDPEAPAVQQMQTDGATDKKPEKTMGKKK